MLSLEKVWNIWRTRLIEADNPNAPILMGVARATPALSALIVYLQSNLPSELTTADLTEASLRSFIQSLHEKGLRPRQIFSYLAELKMFLRWLAVHEYISEVRADDLIKQLNNDLVWRAE